MPCVSVPKPAIPDIAPLSFAPPRLPSPSFNAELCCKVAAFSAPPIAPTLPPKTVNPAFLKALRTYGKIVLGALDKLVVNCPKE